MNNRTKIINFYFIKKLAFILITFLLIILIITNIRLSHNCLYESQCYDDSIHENIENKLFEMSIKLNKAMQTIGKLKCEIDKSFNHVWPRGDWCFFRNLQHKNMTQYRTDLRLAKALSHFLKDKIVASFGDGRGIYKEIIDELNEVILYDAFDGSPYAELNSKGNVKFLDLTIQIYHLDQYDWVLSIGVGQHIPIESENVYLDNLKKHAKEGVILSWDRQDFDYVKFKLESIGFKHDLKASIYLKNRSELNWIKENINVFRKKLIYK